MAAFTNTTGSVNYTSAFTEAITSGVTQPLGLNAGVSLNTGYNVVGTAAGQVDLIYAKQLSLAGSATTLDLTSLTDLNGAAINFARVRELVIVNLAVTATFTVTVGNAASNAWSTGPIGTATGTAIIQPSVGQTVGSAKLVWSDPYSVGASTGGYVDATHKLLKLDPGANTILINIILVGCSAVS